MKKNIWIKIIFVASGISCYVQNPEDITLKNYRPRTIYKIPVSKIERAKFPGIDMRSHQYAKSKEQLTEWIKTMDKVGIEKTIILSGVAGVP